MMHERTGHDAVALCLAFSADGRCLASGHVDGAVHLWDLERGQELPVKFRHEALVGAVAFSPDGQTLASGGMDSNLKLWNLPAALAGEARRELHRQPAGHHGAVLRGRGGRVARDRPRQPRAAPRRRPQRAARWRRCAGPEAQVSLLSHRARRQALRGREPRPHDPAVRRRQPRSSSSSCPAIAPSRPRRSRSFPTAGTWRSVALDNSVQLWDLESQSPSAVLWGQANESFSAVALFGGGDHVAAAMSDGRLRLWGAV